MTTPDLLVHSNRGPVLVAMPDGTQHRDAHLFLGTAPDGPRVMVYVRPGTLVVDEPWDPAGSMGMPSPGHIWQVATPLGPLQITPTRGCASCGGASWWRNHQPFPDQRGQPLARFLESWRERS